MASDEKNPIDAPEAHLEGLGERFLQALALREKHDVDGAAEVLRGVLKDEPRLAEPRMELGRLLLDTGQLEEAQEEAREAIRILEAGGQWIEDLSEEAVLSTGYGLLAEVLRQLAGSDEYVFGDPEAWKAINDESRAAFAKAHELDPENAHAGYWSGGLDAPPEDPSE